MPRQIVTPVLVTLFGLAALVTLPVPGHAQFISPNRVSFFDITFSSSDFSNANAFYKVTEDAYSISGPSTVPGYTPALKSDHTGFTWVSYGGTTLSNISETSNSATADLTSNGTFGGYVFTYNTLAETGFNNLGGTFGNTWIVRNSFGGLIGLEFQGGGTGLVDNNGSFALDVLINGNWSNQGTGPFQTQFLGLDPNWTIDKNFVFNGTDTEFLAHINPYNATPPNLDFILHGPVAVTPEPSAVAFLLTGGLSAAFALRRRKSSK